MLIRHLRVGCQAHRPIAQLRIQPGGTKGDGDDSDNPFPKTEQHLDVRETAVTFCGGNNSSTMLRSSLKARSYAWQAIRYTHGKLTGARCVICGFGETAVSAG